MLTPLSITSLDQGKALAHWQMRRLYGETVNSDTERSEASVEVQVPVANSPVDAAPAHRSFLAVLIAWWQAARATSLHRKDCETSSA